MFLLRIENKSVFYRLWYIDSCKVHYVRDLINESGFIMWPMELITKFNLKCTILQANSSVIIDLQLYMCAQFWVHGNQMLESLVNGITCGQSTPQHDKPRNNGNCITFIWYIYTHANFT